MNLDDIVTKEATDVTPEEKTFLEEHKTELDDDTAKKFGIDNSPVIPDPTPRGGTPPADGGKGGDGNPPKDGDGEGDDDDDPETKKKISKMVDAQVAPIRQQLQEQKDIAEVDNFVRANADKYPIAGKYRDAMLRYMKVYTNVPAEGVFKIVAGDELIRIGAQLERKASEKANGTRVSSNSARPAGGAGKKDWGTASTDDFKAKKQEILGRPV